MNQIYRYSWHILIFIYLLCHQLESLHSRTIGQQKYYEELCFSECISAETNSKTSSGIFMFQTQLTIHPQVCQTMILLPKSDCLYQCTRIISGLHILHQNFWPWMKAHWHSKLSTQFCIKNTSFQFHCSISIISVILSSFL